MSAEIDAGTPGKQSGQVGLYIDMPAAWIGIKGQVMKLDDCR